MLRVVAGFCSGFLILSMAQGATAVPEVVNLTFAPCGGMIFLPVTLADGKSHLLLLDTGNVSSWLVADTARSLGLRLEPIEPDGKAVPGVFRLGVQTVSLQGRELSGKFLALGREQFLTAVTGNSASSAAGDALVAQRLAADRPDDSGGPAH